jgi:hypothetical protein
VSFFLFSILEALTLIPCPNGEVFFDTARAVTNLILSGTVTKYANIKWVIPHAGGALPPLIDRFTGFSAVVFNDSNGPSPEEVGTILRERFWYDTAGVSVLGHRSSLTAPENC